MNGKGKDVNVDPGTAVSAGRQGCNSAIASGSLCSYNKSKLALAAQVRGLQNFLLARHAVKDFEERCRELMVKLAEDRFTLAVVGQFKRGKSSLMNAVVGREILPVGILPLTSAITVLRFGPKERLLIDSGNSSLRTELPLSELPDYATEQGNPGNIKNVKMATVEIPSLFLRRGLEFVDTPGIGSVIQANTATTYGFLPRCDAVLFVTSAETALSMAEVDFLRNMREHVNHVFLVVNKIDLLDESELREVLDFNAGKLRGVIDDKIIGVFPVSARRGIAAKTADDIEGYEKSGMKKLEDSLSAFLADEKAAGFLSSVAQKTLRLLNEALACMAGQGFVGTASGELENIRNGLTPEDAETVRSLEAKIKSICAAALSGVSASSEPVSTPSGKSAFYGNAPDAQAVRPDLLKDMQASGCPLCRNMAADLSDFFARWQYELTKNEKAQAHFANEMGFCPLHTWQMLAVQSPRGASIAYARLLERIGAELRKLKDVSDAGERIGGLQKKSGSCQACRVLTASEEKFARMFSDFIASPEGRKVYSGSSGLCLRHLSLVTSSIPDKGVVKFLVSDAARRFEEVSEDMQNYAMKRDAMKGYLVNSDEKNAYRRAVVLLAGARSVCAPWSEDGEVF